MAHIEPFTAFGRLFRLALETFAIDGDPARTAASRIVLGMSVDYVHEVQDRGIDEPLG